MHSHFDAFSNVLHSSFDASTCSTRSRATRTATAPRTSERRRRTTRASPSMISTVPRSWRTRARRRARRGGPGRWATRWTRHGHRLRWQDRGPDQDDAYPWEAEARWSLQQEPLHHGAIGQRAGHQVGLPVRAQNQVLRGSTSCIGMRMHANANECIRIHTNNAYECIEMHTNACECIRMHLRTQVNACAGECIWMRLNA